MTTTTTTDISTVAAEVTKLQALWSAAEKQYEAKKAALAGQIDTYVAAHQSAADQHTTEIKVATALKATIVPVVAAAETATSDIESFVLSQPWYTKAAAWVEKQKRYLLWLLGVLALFGIYKIF